MYINRQLKKLVQEDLYQLNDSFRTITYSADICCSRSMECAYDTTSSETGSGIVEEKAKNKSVPWYV
jgi:hypothetical protein